MGIITEQESDIKIQLYVYNGNYYSGNLYFNDVCIHYSELNDIIEFAVSTFKNNGKEDSLKGVRYPQDSETPDYYYYYYIDISLDKNNCIVEVDRFGGIEDPLEAMEFCAVEEKDIRFYRKLIKNKAKELAANEYPCISSGSEFKTRIINVNNKKIQLIRDFSIQFFETI